MKQLYRVAGHAFSVSGEGCEDLFAMMTQYEPFAIESTDEPLVFQLRVADASALPAGTVERETEQDDDGSQIMAGRLAGRPYFEFLLWGRRAARLVTSDDYSEATVVLDGERMFGLNNAMMVLYALSTATRQTALFHSSVVSKDGRAYMFLGKSGTGKSTHSSLWLRHISETALVNDDNPVVRRTEAGFRVYGSPWSGKTPCYRNVSYPLGGVVLLSQAPYNRIERLRTIKAYAALVPSISGKRWDPRVADGLHQTENLMAKEVAVWHLDCLPDEAAARLCHETINANHQ